MNGLSIQTMASVTVYGTRVLGYSGGFDKSASRESTKINLRRPTVFERIHPSAMSAYIFVRPSPVASQASATVQVIRPDSGPGSIPSGLSGFDMC